MLSIGFYCVTSIKNIFITIIRFYIKKKIKSCHMILYEILCKKRHFKVLSKWFTYYLTKNKTKNAFCIKPYITTLIFILPYILENILLLLIFFGIQFLLKLSYRITLYVCVYLYKYTCHLRKIFDISDTCKSIMSMVERLFKGCWSSISWPYEYTDRLAIITGGSFTKINHQKHSHRCREPYNSETIKRCKHVHSCRHTIYRLSVP